MRPRRPKEPWRAAAETAVVPMRDGLAGRLPAEGARAPPADGPSMPPLTCRHAAERASPRAPPDRPRAARPDGAGAPSWPARAAPQAASPRAAPEGANMPSLSPRTAATSAAEGSPRKPWSSHWCVGDFSCAPTQRAEPSRALQECHDAVKRRYVEERVAKMIQRRLSQNRMAQLRAAHHDAQRAMREREIAVGSHTLKVPHSEQGREAQRCSAELEYLPVLTPRFCDVERRLAMPLGTRCSGDTSSRGRDEPISVTWLSNQVPLPPIDQLMNPSTMDAVLDVHSLIKQDPELSREQFRKQLPSPKPMPSLSTLLRQLSDICEAKVEADVIARVRATRLTFVVACCPTTLNLTLAYSAPCRWLS